jgi:hypothetical protein
MHLLQQQLQGCLWLAVQQQQLLLQHLLMMSQMTECILVQQKQQ